MPLSKIVCPNCKAIRDADDLAVLKSKTFSNIHCVGCQFISSSKFWRCTCHNLWYKCPVHYKIHHGHSTGAKGIEVNRKRKSILTDKPPPKRQEAEVELCRTRVVDDSIREYRIDPDLCPALAAKFPHLVKKRPGGVQGVLAPQGTEPSTASASVETVQRKDSELMPKAKQPRNQ